MKSFRSPIPVRILHTTDRTHFNHKLFQIRLHPIPLRHCDRTCRFTLYQDDTREVFLTDLSGGWYYSDAFRTDRKGTYGYSRLDRKYIANWEGH